MTFLSLLQVLRCSTFRQTCARTCRCEMDETAIGSNVSEHEVLRAWWTQNRVCWRASEQEHISADHAMQLDSDT